MSKWRISTVAFVCDTHPSVRQEHRNRTIRKHDTPAAFLLSPASQIALRPHAAGGERKTKAVTIKRSAFFRALSVPATPVPIHTRAPRITHAGRTMFFRLSRVEFFFILFIVPCLSGKCNAMSLPTILGGGWVWGKRERE